MLNAKNIVLFLVTALLGVQLTIIGCGGSDDSSGGSNKESDNSIFPSKLGTDADSE